MEAYRGRLDEADRLVETAASAFTAGTVNAGLAECRLLQARLLRCRGHYRESLALLEQAAAGLNGREAAPRFDLVLEKGYNLALSGDLRGAEHFLTGALEPIRRSGNLQAGAYLAEALGNIYYQQGRHARALQTFQWGMRVSAEGSLPGYYTQDTIPYIYCEWGEMEKAMEWAQKNVAAKERYNLVETLPSAYCALSYVYFNLGDYARVEEITRKALELHYQHGTERYFLLLNQSKLAWCRFARGPGRAIELHWQRPAAHRRASGTDPALRTGA